MSIDLVSKFDALNARFYSDLDAFNRIQSESLKLLEEFKSCRWWQLVKQARLISKMHDLQKLSGLRVSQMAKTHSEMEETRKEIEGLLLAIQRDRLGVV